MAARSSSRRLLTFAKRGSPARQPTDLRQLLEESILLSLSGSSVRCERRIGPTPATANVDPGQVAQVLSNLLVNARQAMNDQGTITVSVSTVEAVLQAGQGPTRAIKLTIADNGPGIPSDISVLAKPFMLHELCSTIKAVLP